MSNLNKDCLFCKIINKEIPTSIIYEDAKCLAFLDITPVNPGHVLVIPKEHYKNIYQTPEETTNCLISLAKKIAIRQENILKAEGTNIHINNNSAAGQAIFHTHIHIIPRYSNDGYKHWQCQPYQDGQIDQIQKKLRF